MQDSPAALGSSDSQGPKRKQTPGCRLALPTFALRWAAITSVRSPENTFTVLEHRTLSTMGNISSGKKSLLERAQSLSPAADARSALRPGLESSPTAPERFDGQQQAPTARKPPLTAAAGNVRAKSAKCASPVFGGERGCHLLSASKMETNLAVLVLSDSSSIRSRNEREFQVKVLEMPAREV